MQSKNSTLSIINTVLIVIVLVVGIMAVNGLSNIPSADDVAAKVTMPTPAEIASLIVIPEVSVVDNTAKIEKILEEVGWSNDDISSLDENNAINYAEGEIDSEDFLELLAELVGIDEDYLIINDLDVRDIEVTAASEDDADDGNFNVEGFLRIEYSDSDDNDDNEDVIYVLTKADITDLYDEENDQDVDYSMSEVVRTFEFD